MIDPTHYTYRVIWSGEDQEFVGLVAEFPSLSYLDEDQAEALKGIVALVEQVVVDMAASHEKIPEPLATKHFSGRFMVRIPPEQHRRLAIEAAEERISLNRLIAVKLAT